MAKRKLYVLWYQGYSSGWPTANNSTVASEYVSQAYTSLAAAKDGLARHNNIYPEDAKSMSIKSFVEVQKTKRRK